MSRTLTQHYFNIYENKVKNDPNFNTVDEINLFLNRWVNGLTFIDDLAKYIQNQNYKINVIFENLTQDNSLSAVKKKCR